MDIEIVEMELEGAPPPPRNLMIDTGEGNDSVDIEIVELQLGGAPPPPPEDPPPTVEVKTGPGDDLASWSECVEECVENGWATKWDLGDGNDVLDGVRQGGSPLEIDSGPGDDTVTVENVAPPREGDPPATVEVNTGDGDDFASWSECEAECEKNGVYDLDLGKGNDTVKIDAPEAPQNGNRPQRQGEEPPVRIVARGGPGKDRMIGSASSVVKEIFLGGGGRDVLRGRGGDDVLKGGGGKDKLVGGPGDDVLRGQGANDLMRGGPGDDLLVGGGGRRDRAVGGSGFDRCRAEIERGCER